MIPIPILSGPSLGSIRPGAEIELHLSVHAPGITDLRYEVHATVREAIPTDDGVWMSAIGYFPDPTDEAGEVQHLAFQATYRPNHRPHSGMVEGPFDFLRQHIIQRL